MKTNSILFCILVYAFLTNTTAAQSNSSCKVKISTSIGDTVYTVVSEAGVLIYNARTNDLELRLPLSSLDHDIDTIENYFNQSTDELVYKGNTGASFFELLKSEVNRDKNFPVTGTLFLNNKSLLQSGTYSILKLNNQNDGAGFKLRFSLFLRFDPRAYDINRIFPELRQPVLIEIDEAIVNVTEQR